MRLKRFNMSEQVIIFDEPDMSFLDSVDSLSNSNHYEYQIRWVDSPLYYKRAKGNDLWNFCTDKEFAENVTPENLVPWKNETLPTGDLISGGVADRMTPSQFDELDLIQGIKVELEHTDDLYIAREIAMDHLAEDPDYYNKLKKIHNH